MSAQCQHCKRSPKTLKRCAACSGAWYCDASCQKADWLIHILDCNIGRPITSADRLGAAVRQGIPPVDAATRTDYGFLHTPRPDDIEKRMKVYGLLIDGLGIRPKTIHQWSQAGALSRMMKATFDSNLSETQRQGVDYQWFSENQSTFGGPPPQDVATNMWLLEAHQKARERISRTTKNSEFDALRSIDGFEDYFLFYTLMLQGARPAPCDGTGLWESFGFCACFDQNEEGYLGSRYLSLFRTATFQEFIHACDNSTLLELFSAYGQNIQSPHIRDVIRSIRSRKSVWTLKDFVCADDELRRDSKPALPICADYGFFNCRNQDEESCLRGIYKNILDRPDSDPLALHQACLQGRIFEYCSELVTLSPPAKFRRLMKNPYPLAEVQEDSDPHARPGPSSGEQNPLTQFFGSLPPGTHRIEQSDLRRVLQDYWQSRSDEGPTVGTFMKRG
ncbi:MYND Zn-finger protein [Ceratobasidium sp. AG-Ba]|nr:MYND Zn-finger protein [Ceratobasidium sp. AG-Ba]